MKNTPERRAVLSFMAHPDDAEIFCGGVLIRLADAGWEVHIATATGGDCGSMVLPADEISALRRGEAANAAKLIGAEYHCLGEPDADVIFNRAATRKTIDLFRQVAPSLIITHPRHDYMIDHEQVHLLARSAAFSYSIPNASSLSLRKDSSMPWLYYCDPLEGSDPYTGVQVDPTVRINVTDQMDRKLEMLACHASQRDWLRQHHGVDEYLDATRRHHAMRGEQLGVTYAEAYVQHAGPPFPQTDLLKELFGGS